MGLDATVYCDCYERGRNLIRAPYPWLVMLDEFGAPSIDSQQDIDILEAHDGWADDPSVCEHGGFTLAEKHLGSGGHIGVIRDIVSRLETDSNSEYPIILEEVIYSGTHCGDYIPANELLSLKAEIDLLGSRADVALSGEEQEILLEFLNGMRELTSAALSVQKPIAF